MRLVPLLLLLAPLSFAQIDEEGGPVARAGKPAQAAGGSILLVGDSHTTMSFGKALDAGLRSGHALATYAVCSSGPKSWTAQKGHACGWFFRGRDGLEPAKWVKDRVSTEQRTIRGEVKDVKVIKTPSLADLLVEEKPDVTVVALGSNPTDAAGIKAVEELIHKGKSRCLWVGPPYMRDPSEKQVDKVYDLLKANLKDCPLIDSRDFAYLRYPEKGGDSTHYAGALSPLGKHWGEDAAKAVELKLKEKP